jgi:hypothetical protein
MIDRELVQRRGAWWVLNPEGDQVEQEIHRNHIWEKGCIEIVEHLSGPGKVFLDVGAHIGWYSVLAALKGSRVVAFEADPERMWRCLQHFALNKIHAEAVPGRAGVDSQVDRAVLDLGLPRVDLLKIDTDGHEPQVLAGAARTLERWHPTILLEVGDECYQAVAGTTDEPGSHTRATLERLAGLGYQFYWERDLAPLTVDQAVAEQLAMKGTINIFCTVDGPPPPA